MKKWNKLLLSAIVLNAMVAPAAMAGTGTAPSTTVELATKADALYNEIFITADDKLKATEFRNLFAQYVYNTIGMHPLPNVTGMTQVGNATELAKWFTVNNVNKQVVLDEKLKAAALAIDPTYVNEYPTQEFIFFLTRYLAPNTYTTSEDITVLRHIFGPMFDELFGEELTVDLLVAFSKDLELELYKKSTWVGLDTTGSNIDSLLKAAMKKAVSNLTEGATAPYRGLDQRLTLGLGVTVDDLLTIRQNMTDGFVAKSDANAEANTFMNEKLVAYGVKKLFPVVTTPPVVTPPPVVVTPPATPPVVTPPPVAQNPNPRGEKVVKTPAVTVTIKKDADGVEVTVVKVNKDDVRKSLKDSKEAQAFVIPVDAKGGKAKAQVDLSLLTEAADTNEGNSFVVTANGATYDLPVGLLNTESLAGLGGDLADASVEVNITEKPTSAVNAGNGKVAAKVVDFSIVVTSGESSLELNNFGSTYVERALDLTGNVDSKKAVGVVVNSDGTVAPVPTEFFEVDGKKVAVLKRNSNSTYTVLENEVELTDIDKSWAKADIQLLANKLLVTGYEDGTFKPQGTVTRAEFVCLLARGLGFDTTDANIDMFSDVASDDWHAGVLKAAVDAGLINGFEDGTFRPDAKITRQDASVVLANAIEFLSLRGDLTDEDVALAVKAYNDQPKVAGYAKSAVGLATSLNILSGNGDGTFNPTANATRAEAVIMLEKLLVEANFLSN